MKNRARKGKMGVKKWGFGGKKWFLGLEKLRLCNQTRKAKWCKMQLLFLKMNNVPRVKV